MKRRQPVVPPASGRAPGWPLSQQDIDASADELGAYLRLWTKVWPRREQCDWSAFYLCGQLANLERKTIEPMVLALRGADDNAMRGLQQFIGQSAWAVRAKWERQQQLVGGWLGAPDAVLIVDGSGFPKQGAHSVGVGPQYCGALGKIANCQEGVFAVYASSHGYAFVDGRLYLPDRWFGDAYAARRKACGVPADLSFQTEPEIALALLTDIVATGHLPFRWVTADEHFGEIPAFLDGIAATGKWYQVEVPVTTRVWLRTPAVQPPGQGLMGRPRLHPRVAPSAPRPIEMKVLATQLPRSAWQRWTIKEGSRGPLEADFALVRVTAVRDGLPGPRQWATFRRSLTDPSQVKCYLSNAPNHCPQAELVRVTGLRWPIETAIEEGKGEVGLDHYETRSWLGWHHHVLQSSMAHLFLMRLRLVFKKKPGPHDRPSAATGGPRHPPAQRPFGRPGRANQLPPAAQSRRLSLASPAHPGPAPAQAPKTLISRSLGVMDRSLGVMRSLGVVLRCRRFLPVQLKYAQTNALRRPHSVQALPVRIVLDLGPDQPHFVVQPIMCNEHCPVPQVR
jgi:SRSO17 transposase